METAAASTRMDSPKPGLTEWLDVHDATLPVDFASHLDAANLARVLERLDRRQHRMALLVQALVQLLQAQGLLEHAQLLSLIEAIDRSDGVVDGRQGRQPSLRCGQCGRENLGNRQRCLYCGSEDLLGLHS